MPGSLLEERVKAAGSSPPASEPLRVPLPVPARVQARRIALWHQRSVSSRLRVLRRARHLLAANAAALADAIPASLSRTRADSLAAEVLPLLAAIKFLERQAAGILAPRSLSRRGLPFWLAGVEARVERVPLGSVLILAPFNYPLLLAGVQAMQALAAGNSVVWKPGRGGQPVAALLARLLTEAGLPEDILRVTDESVATAEMEIARRPAKILFTGSAANGRAVLRAAAETITPVIAELSGCDAVFVLPTADPEVVADALLFGLRLNGSQTCMAPRRLILVDIPPHHGLRSRAPHQRGQDQRGPEQRGPNQQAPDQPVPPDSGANAQERPLAANHQRLLDLLLQRLPAVPSMQTAPPFELLDDAVQAGAQVRGTPGKPYLVLGATPDMRIARSDVFYPVLSVLRAASPEAAIELHGLCPLSLTASIFGEHTNACWLAASLSVGTVLVNDLIVPTADPRLCFGGRGESGFGVTRGREGLLELTAIKTTSVRRKRDYRHLQATTAAHEPLFTGLIELTHAGSWRARLAGMQKLFRAARSLGSANKK